MRKIDDASHQIDQNSFPRIAQREIYKIVLLQIIADEITIRRCYPQVQIKQARHNLEPQINVSVGKTLNTEDNIWDGNAIGTQGDRKELQRAAKQIR